MNSNEKKIILILDNFELFIFKNPLFSSFFLEIRITQHQLWNITLDHEAFEKLNSNKSNEQSLIRRLNFENQKF